MSLIQAILLGLVQGLAEFLPISSSGHLVILKNIFRLNTDMDNIYDIMLHLGTLCAVFVVYWKDIKELIVEGVSIVGGWCFNAGRFVRNCTRSDKRAYRKVINSPYRRFVLMILISTIPTGILGIVLEKIVGGAASQLLLPGICLLITAGVLAIADHVRVGAKNEKTATYKDSLIVGIVQGVATLPGISRSGSTIVACLLCGFNKEFAVKYSFIMSVPAIVGAVVLQIPDLGSLTSPISYYLAGMVVAGVVGFLCIKYMLVLLQKNKFKIFSIYCLCAGILAIVGFFII